MKTKLLTIIFALCMILGTTAMAVEYTVADMLGVSGTMAMSVSSVSLQKVVEGDQKTAKVTPYDEMAQLWQGLLELPVTFFDKPLEESKERKIINFSISSEVKNAQYTYDNHWGFSYNDGEKTLVLRYLVSEESLDELINGLILQWEKADDVSDVIAKFTIGNNTFKINNEEKQIDENCAVVPYIDEKASRTMVPLRAMAEALGYWVSWDEESKSIVLEKNRLYVNIQIGSDEIRLEQYDIDDIYDMNGLIMTLMWEEQLETDSAPCIVNDRTFIPLRTVAEIFGFHVEWNEETQDIYIRERTDTGFYPFPKIEVSDTSAGVELNSYNTSYMTYSIGFNDSSQIEAYIYNRNGNKIGRIGPSSATLALTQRNIYYNIPDKLAFGIPVRDSNRMKKGSYYADVYFEGYKTDAYRVFFEVE